MEVDTILLLEVFTVTKEALVHRISRCFLIPFWCPLSPNKGVGGRIEAGDIRRTVL